jgi:hypothetical protein
MIKRKIELGLHIKWKSHERNVCNEYFRCKVSKHIEKYACKIFFLLPISIYQIYRYKIINFRHENNFELAIIFSHEIDRHSKKDIDCKVQIFWEGNKIWKNLPLKIWCYSVASNFKWKVFSLILWLSQNIRTSSHKLPDVGIDKFLHLRLRCLYPILQSNKSYYYSL